MGRETRWQDYLRKVNAPIKGMDDQPLQSRMENLERYREFRRMVQKYLEGVQAWEGPSSYSLPDMADWQKAARRVSNTDIQVLSAEALEDLKERQNRKKQELVDADASDSSKAGPLESRVTKCGAVRDSKTNSGGEDWAISLGWLIPRKYRAAFVGDILEDCADMREAGCAESHIKFQAVWQWAIAMITLVPMALKTSILDLLKQVLSGSK